MIIPDAITGSDHPVAQEWHFTIMIDLGYEAITKNQKGLVRHYLYQHPCKHAMMLCTGVNADYWRDQLSGTIGYHSTLKEHCEKRIKEIIHAIQYDAKS